jgi:hypothetical protein
VVAKVASIVNVLCDRPTCPAPAQQLGVAYGQDFYFCNHHHAEVAELLATLSGDFPRYVTEVEAASGAG